MCVEVTEEFQFIADYETNLFILLTYFLTELQKIPLLIIVNTKEDRIGLNTRITILNQIAC